MIEKVKAVNNPLTIIAIFAGLAEVAGTVVLALVDKNIQHIFVWFVMFFPVFLVACFFYTLFFKARVLYAPSDFKDEQNFMSMIVGTQDVYYDLEEVPNQIEAAKDKINEAIEKITVVGESERSKISEILNSHLKQIEEKIESTRQTAEVVASNASEFAKDRDLVVNTAASFSRLRHSIHRDAESGAYVMRRANKINRSVNMTRKSHKVKVERNSNGISSVNNEDHSTEE